MVVVSDGLEVPYTVPQPLFLAIQPARKQVPPQADAALAAAVESRILTTGIFSRAHETSGQPFICRRQRIAHGPIAHAKLAQHARRFLPENVPRRRRRDPL